MHKLYDYACDELEELEKKVEKGGDLTVNEVEYAKTLAKLKHYLKDDYEMESEYSGRMMYDDRSYRYDDGRSYARNRRTGRYSRDMERDRDRDRMM